MSLREEVQNYSPYYLWEELNHPENFTITNEEFNARWNLIRSQGDLNSETLSQLIQVLYDTVLNEYSGAEHLRIDTPEYNTDNLLDVVKIIDSRLKTNKSDLTMHKQSADHDERYYTKEQLIPWIRGGDTNRIEEVFTIVTADNGDGTFTYTSKTGPVMGTLTEEGTQVFALQQGSYSTGQHRVEIIINDTLRRSVASGGLIEISETSVGLTSPEGAGAEITIVYYERLGFAAEYNIKVGWDKPPASGGKTLWFEVIPYEAI